MIIYLFIRIQGIAIQGLTAVCWTIALPLGYNMYRLVTIIQQSPTCVQALPPMRTPMRNQCGPNKSFQSSPTPRRGLACYARMCLAERGSRMDIPVHRETSKCGAYDQLRYLENVFWRGQCMAGCQRRSGSYMAI